MEDWDSVTPGKSLFSLLVAPDHSRCSIAVRWMLRVFGPKQSYLCSYQNLWSNCPGGGVVRAEGMARTNSVHATPRAKPAVSAPRLICNIHLPHTWPAPSTPLPPPYLVGSPAVTFTLQYHESSSRKDLSVLYQTRIRPQ